MDGFYSPASIYLKTRVVGNSGKKNILFLRMSIFYRARVKREIVRTMSTC